MLSTDPQFQDRCRTSIFKLRAPFLTFHIEISMTHTVCACAPMLVPAATEIGGLDSSQRLNERGNLMGHLCS